MFTNNNNSWFWTSRETAAPPARVIEKEKIVNVPVPYPVKEVVEKIVDRPVEKIVEKIVEVDRPYPVAVPVPVPMRPRCCPSRCGGAGSWSWGPQYPTQQAPW